MVGHARTDAPIKTLTELRNFNLARPARGAIKYGQAQLDNSDEMDLEADRARYEADRAKDIQLAGTNGIDAAMQCISSMRCLFPAGTGAALASKPGYPTVIDAVRDDPQQSDATVPGCFRRQACTLRRQLHWHGL